MRGGAVADALLKIDGLSKRFGGVVASDNIVLDVRPGELHAIIGPNGAGKTTLIGAVTLLVLEETLPLLIKLVATPLVGPAASRAAEYWQIVLGPLFLLVVLFARGGINGLLESLRRD